MRRGVHLLIGAFGILAYSYLLSLILEIPANTLLMGFFATLFGSVMPDAIEPARTWSHRGLGHSRRMLRLAGWLFALTAVLGLLQIAVPDLSVSYIVSAFFLGYGLHLLADSVTPAGLPD